MFAASAARKTGLFLLQQQQKQGLPEYSQAGMIQAPSRIYQ
ncbi:hypothetical protein E6C60_0638 [Paenibacillus algicola]|uniref:Uncharacterized protein n=1 Tax=Paenibacillus algicola TaxID=2565926 RepID=A0A4P8XIN6_9BACL|nr:hypothetical protein E6C60_0638 [Paenibacillus algicola]